MTEYNKVMDDFLAKLREDACSEPVDLEQMRRARKDMDVARLDVAEKKKAIRSLMNVRRPRAISDELLAAQALYLKEELIQKGIVTLSEIPTVKE